MELINIQIQLKYREYRNSLKVGKIKKLSKMKTLIETTTGFLASQMILDNCGEYAGEYQDEAFEIIDSVYEDELSFITNQWCDIMYDQNHKVYAIFATDALTCWNAEVLYVELEESDCPKAFENMRTKINY